MHHPVLVIGGGISGITAALEAAEGGCAVMLVEKQPWLGGRVARLNRYFPKLCPPSCGLEINYQRLRRNKRIRLFTSSVVESITGTKGNFTVTIRKNPRYVTDLCTGCGECVSVCPVSRPDEFTYGIKQTKAIYIPDIHPFPFFYAIDEEVCLKTGCGRCVSACPYGAVDLGAMPETITREVSSVILATGWKPYDASRMPELGYGLSDKIITNVMMETVLEDLERPQPSTIAFAQCAGSRDINHLPYCSGICCGTTLKHALLIREKLPGCRVMVFYIDLRVQGRNEDILAKAQADPDISFIKGKIASVSPGQNNQVVVEAEDMMHQKKIRVPVDVLVLATGMVPEKSGIRQVKYLKNSFVDKEKLPDGFFAVGNALHPSDVSTSVKEATAAALKGLQVFRFSGSQVFGPDL